MNILGYELLHQNEVKYAIEIFKLNVNAYPKAWNVYDSLGEAYLRNSQEKLAIRNYKKSLKLNPANQNAKEILRRFIKRR